MNPTDVLTNRIGPLPAWVWGGIAGAGILGWRVWRARGTAKVEATDATAPATDDYSAAVARPDLLSGRDTAGYPATGSAAPDPGASYQDLTPPDWVLNPPAWLDELPGLLLNQPPIEVIVTPGPVADTPTAPASPATPAPLPPAPRPAPAVTLPTLGPWAAEPAPATKRSLAAQGYRIVRRGDGKWIAVDKDFRG